MEKNKEIRNFDLGGIETRNDETSNEIVIDGYVNKFDKPSQFMGFFEKVTTGAFTRSLKENQDIPALYNHESGRPLGRTSNGTLKLWEDETGLRFSLKPNMELYYAKDMLQLINANEIRGMSFGFVVNEDKIDMVDGVAHRTLLDVDLLEVSLVLNPAYLDSGFDVAQRSIDNWKEEVHKKERNDKLKRKLMIELELN